MDINQLLNGYDLTNLTVGVLGGHSALDCTRSQRHGFKTVAIAQTNRSKRTIHTSSHDGRGCIDEVITVEKFEDVLDADVQKQLRDMNTIFIANRYFWVYFKGL